MSIRGRFVWEELMTTDTTSAASFYAKVAGLKTKPAPFDASYTVFKAGGGRSMGGLMTLPAEAKAGGTPPTWMSYVGVANVDDVARQVGALGGKVAKAPWNIADGGRIAILQDPQGAIFAVYANPKATDMPADVLPGQASWHELATSDYIGAFSFYQSLFGWHVVNDMDMGPGMGTYRLFAPEGAKDACGGIYTKPAQQPGPPAWLPYIKVANVQAATATAKKLGATIMHGPAEVPGGWITMGADPQGVMFALHSTPAASAAKRKTAPRRKSKSKPKAAPKKKAAPKRRGKAKASVKKKGAKKRKAGSKK